MSTSTIAIFAAGIMAGITAVVMLLATGSLSVPTTTTTDTVLTNGILVIACLTVSLAATLLMLIAKTPVNLKNPAIVADLLIVITVIGLLSGWTIAALLPLSAAILALGMAAKSHDQNEDNS